jgi:hypothetical protein
MIRLRGSPTVLRNGLAHAGTRDLEKSTQFRLRAVVDPHELFLSNFRAALDTGARTLHRALHGT